MMMKGRTIGAYEFKHFANKGKIEKIKEVFKEYRKTAQAIAKFLWNEFFKTGRLPHKKQISVKHIQSNLSERYKQVCLWQVIDVLESYISNLQNKFAKIVFGSSLNREDKLILLALNRQKAWFRYDKEEIQIHDNGEAKIVRVRDYHKLLAKKIFKHLLKTNKRPSFKNISMHLDAKVAEFLPKQEGKAKSFDYWLKLSTLEKGKPIYIPLKKNSYAESLEGKFLNFYQVIEKDGELKFSVAKALEKKSYVPSTDVVAIDLGLNPLFATDKGDLMGRRFLEFLKEMDYKLTKRMASLQRRKIRPSQDEKFRRMVERLRAFLRSEINRLLNRVVNLYRPAKLVVEKLDFRSPELSKRMNRLIQNFGKKFIKEKLQRFQELYGIEVVEVHPAYSSQECSNCGYVDERNRKSTQEFECKACGKKINAQVNGARNILKRSSLGDIKLHTPKKQVLWILLRQYLERLNGCNSAPVKLLKENPYFRDCLSSFKPLECGVNKCL